MQTVILKNNQPKFIYAHFMITHPPFYNDSLGQPFGSATVAKREAYLHQVSRANRIIKKITDNF